MGVALVLIIQYYIHVNYNQNNNNKLAYIKMVVGMTCILEMSLSLACFIVG